MNSWAAAARRGAGCRCLFNCSIVLFAFTLALVTVPVFAGTRPTSNSKSPGNLSTIFGMAQPASAPPIVDQSDENTNPADALAPINSAAYGERLSKVESDIHRALDARNSAIESAALSTADADVGGIARCTVLVRDTLVSVDNRPIRSTISRLPTIKSPSDRRDTMLAICGQMDIIRQEALAAAKSSASQSAEDDARSILRKSEFSSIPPKPISAFDERAAAFWDNVGRWFQKHLHGTLPSFSVNPEVPKYIFITLCVVVGSLLAFLLIRSLIGMAGSTNWGVMANADDSALAITAEEKQLVATRNHEGLIRLAELKADEGQFRDAYRLVYLADLILLDLSGDLKLARSKTNWEYLRQIEALKEAELFALLEPITSEFDRIWYGCETANRKDYDNIRMSYSGITSALKARSAAVPVGKASV